MKNIFDVIKLIMKQKWKFLLSVLMMIFSSATAGIGYILLVPIAQDFLSKDSGDISNQFINIFQDILAFFNIEVTFYSMLFSVVLFNVLKMIFDVLRIIITENMLMNYENSAREQLFEAFIKTKWTYLLKIKHGTIQNALITEVIKVSNVIFSYSNILSFILTIVFLLFLSVSLIGVVNILIIVGFGSVIAFVMTFLIKIQKRLGKKLVTRHNIIHSIIIEGLSGLKYIKAAFIHKYYMKRFNKNVKEFTKTFRNHKVILKSTQYINDPIVIVGLSLILLVIKIFNLNVEIVSLGISIIIFNKIYSLIIKLITELQNVSKNLYSVDLCTSIIEESKNEYEVSGSVEFLGLKKEIRFDNVDFSYTNDQFILKNASFSINTGKTVAFVGKSGCGKTTVVDIILGLYRVNSGKVYIDGIDIEELNLKLYRKSIGYVPQDPFIINDTIEANIVLGNNKYTINDIHEVMSMAYIDEFIKDLPDGLETVVGEKGTRLSGGQKQRISLARALLKKPDILILDEATSSLDNHSEFVIQKAIDSLKNKMTIIIIAHRLNTVKNASLLYEINEGNVVPIDFNSYLNKLNNKMTGENDK